LSEDVTPVAPVDQVDQVDQVEPPQAILVALRELVEGHEQTTQAAQDDGERGAALVAWWRDWEVGPELGELLVEHLCELGPSGLAMALPLHEELHPILQAKLNDDPED